MPENFSWIIKDKLAGMERPGLVYRFEEDIEYLKRMRIDIIINLEEHSRNYDHFETKHIPIGNSKVPRQEDFLEFTDFVHSKLRLGNRVVVHCHAGMGRTNLMIASYIIYISRMEPEGALEYVMERRPLFSVNEEQIQALQIYYNRFIKELK